MVSAQKLLEKYKLGTCSNEEKALLQRWLHEVGKTGKTGLNEGDLSRVELEMWTAIAMETAITEKPQNVKKMRLLRYWPAVAAVCFGAFVSIMFFQNKKISKPEQEAILPGKSGAMLVLSDGKRISLSDSTFLTLKDNGTEILYDHNKLLTYEQGSTGDTTTTNTLSTGRAQQYKLALPDGTLVYLNAESKITFSPGLGQMQKRLVNLVGEAYFEVAKKTNSSFTVHTATQTVKVLGTHFNVKSYPDEVTTKTTLVEGSVRVSTLSGAAKASSVVLIPNQQAIFQNNEFKVSNVNIEEETAWLQNKFVFHSQDLEGLMKEVSKWYNVDVVFKDDVGGIKLTGSISRFVELQKLLDKLEKTGLVKFDVDRRTITVTKG